MSVPKSQVTYDPGLEGPGAQRSAKFLCVPGHIYWNMTSDQPFLCQPVPSIGLVRPGAGISSQSVDAASGRSVLATCNRVRLTRLGTTKQVRQFWVFLSRT